MYHAQVRPVIDAYLDLTQKLSSDDAAGASAAVAALRKAVKDAEPHGLAETDTGVFTSQMHALDGSLPEDGAALDKIREKLPGMTQALETLLKSFGHTRPRPLAEAYCPMAFKNQGAAWLQADSKIENPYFGKKMFRCGEIRAMIAADGSVAHE
jgi:Cu(I)/Ag(I) efflux system membrane fusion protein